ncbi:uncharacterized protein C8R40DRAFT_251610 [Lentinula edodes]|uniref:uncharacterized protein n=1 Tax=Lentinula edodes TaxID=5353 RepID=UPI001E8E678D|nr:uncharacterized protein C8R40DRAFT_251610 [Lentinula edodes]KAH7880403.1 hypothetical protein C8R40DRAFT_251610 [Lentinula edodes]
MDKFGLTSNSFSESFGVHASLPFSDNRGPYCESWFLGYGIDIIIRTKVVNLASRQVDGQYYFSFPSLHHDTTFVLNIVRSFLWIACRYHCNNCGTMNRHSLHQIAGPSSSPISNIPKRFAPHLYVSVAAIHIYTGSTGPQGSTLIPMVARVVRKVRF